MRAFMLGWEFPPYITGGLGTACYGLTRALAACGARVSFVLPRAIGDDAESPVELLSPTSLCEPAASARASGAPPAPGVLGNAYATGTPRRYAGPLPPGRPAPRSVVEADRAVGDYAGDLPTAARRYAELAVQLAALRSFDVVHAHDWITFPAGRAVAEAFGKPLVAHVHATELDRSGDGANEHVWDIERAGMEAADRVVCVSRLTKRMVVDHYGIPESRTAVIHNGIDGRARPAPPKAAGSEAVVLFLGRITMQKGPEYFIAAAKKVLEHVDRVKFVVAGSGDLAGKMIERVAAARLGRRVLFTGFLRGADVERAFRSADVYVMPSVSEPFGLTALEAIRNGVPVIVSKTSGVAEVLGHGAMRVDFWDVDQLANKIVAALRRPALTGSLNRHALAAFSGLSWATPARRCLAVWRELAPGRAAGAGVG